MDRLFGRVGLQPRKTRAALVDLEGRAAVGAGLQQQNLLGGLPPETDRLGEDENLLGALIGDRAFDEPDRPGGQGRERDGGLVQLSAAGEIRQLRAVATPGLMPRAATGS